MEITAINQYHKSQKKKNLSTIATHYLRHQKQNTVIKKNPKINNVCNQFQWTENPKILNSFKIKSQLNSARQRLNS